MIFEVQLITYSERRNRTSARVLTSIFYFHYTDSIPNTQYHSSEKVRKGKKGREWIHTCTYLKANMTFTSTSVRPRLLFSPSRCCCLLSESHILLWMLHGSWMNHFQVQDYSTNKHNHSNSSSYASCVCKIIYRGKIRTGNFFPKYSLRENVVRGMKETRGKKIFPDKLYLR